MRLQAIIASVPQNTARYNVLNAENEAPQNASLFYFKKEIICAGVQPFLNFIVIIAA